jgi:hypothetical protein
MARTFGLVVLLASVGCASHYAYTFQLTDPGAQHATTAGEPDAIEDAELKTEILVDTVADALVLGLTNKTAQVLQVDWPKITIARSSGNATTLRPDVDLGWLPPGARVTARLFPIARELGRFLDDARVPLDNNASERSLRRVALGRKNYPFVGDVDAGMSIAGLYTLVATCEARGINPFADLADVIPRVQDHPKRRLDELLPGPWARAQAGP